MKEGIMVKEYIFSKEEFMKKMGLKGKIYSVWYGIDEIKVKVEVE